MFNDSKNVKENTGPLKNDEKKSENYEKVKEKEKITDPFDRKIRVIDEKIRNLVENNAKTERMRKEEEERKALDVKSYKKKRENISLAEKFSSLNLKARYRINKISEILQKSSKPKISENKSERINTLIKASETVHFPIIDLKRHKL